MAHRKEGVVMNEEQKYGQCVFCKHSGKDADVPPCNTCEWIDELSVDDNWEPQR